MDCCQWHDVGIAACLLDAVGIPALQCERTGRPFYLERGASRRELWSVPLRQLHQKFICKNVGYASALSQQSAVVIAVEGMAQVQEDCERREIGLRKAHSYEVFKAVFLDPTGSWQFCGFIIWSQRRSKE